MQRERPQKFDDSDDALDRLLQSARWPEPRPEQIGRLKQHWRVLRRGRGAPSNSFWMFAALAAALFVATAAASWRWIGAENMASLPRPVKESRGEGVPPNRATANSMAPHPHPHPHPGPLPVGVTREVGPATLAKGEGRGEGRPTSHSPHIIAFGSAAGELTRYEQVASLAVLRHHDRQQQGRRRQRPQAMPERTRLDAALASVTAANQTEPTEQGTLGAAAATLAWRTAAMAATAQLAPQPVRYEPALCAILRTPAATAAGQSRRLAAARLLSQLGTRRSIDLLNRLAAEPDLHDAAVIGLARWANEDQLDHLIVAERQPELRRLLLTSLLERADAPALERYLLFVNDPAWNDLALGAAQETTRAPVEQLFDCLEGQQVSLREAAAKTLANLPDPLVLNRLAEHVMQNVSRREALVGLLASPYPQAADFLQSAKQDLYLMAAVQAAESEIPWLTEYPRR